MKQLLMTLAVTALLATIAYVYACPPRPPGERDPLTVACDSFIEASEKFDPTAVKTLIVLYQDELKRKKDIRAANEALQARMKTLSESTKPVYVIEWNCIGFSRTVFEVVAKDAPSVVLATPVRYTSHLDDKKKARVGESHLLALTPKWFEDNGLERGKAYVMRMSYWRTSNPAGHRSDNRLVVYKGELLPDGNITARVGGTELIEDGRIEMPIVWE